jgi:leucyl-tRNA synthetase
MDLSRGLGDVYKRQALADEKVIAALDGEVPKKIIVIPGRMVNLVV